MSLAGLHLFMDADNATAARLLRESQHRLLVIVAVRGLVLGVLFGCAIAYLAR
jgi:hypothetical protein